MHGQQGRVRPRRHHQPAARKIDFVELHDAYTSSEIQTYEDMGLCRYGEGGPFAESGAPFMPNLDYGLVFDEGRFFLKKKKKIWWRLRRVPGEPQRWSDRVRASRGRDGG